jgi:hypothetical protein
LASYDALAEIVTRLKFDLRSSPNDHQSADLPKPLVFDAGRQLVPAIGESKQLFDCRRLIGTEFSSLPP